MTSGLIIGVGLVSLRIRSARSLKDRRQVMRSIIQKLRNQGFSATESDDATNSKLGSIGFAYVSPKAPDVERALEKAMRLFVGDFEVVSTSRDVFDYSGELRLSEPLEEI